MDIDLGVPFGSTNKRLRMNGPSQGADRNGQLTDDNIIGSSHRGTLKNIEIFLSNPIIGYLCCNKCQKIGSFLYRP